MKYSVPEHPAYDPIASSVSNVVVAGTGFAIAAITGLLLHSYYVLGNNRAVGSIAICTLAGMYIVIAHTLARWHFYKTSASLLITFYLLIASCIAWSWGINTPLGPLIFGLVIVLAGILLTAKHALWAAATACSILLAIQATITLGWHHPDISWTNNQSDFGDVLGYCTIFGMLALASWLYNREMERSLHQARRAEIALTQQKLTLKRQVEERTKDLRRVQLEEMRQMYRFVSLGQLGVTLMHDLANHLTALTLEIEDIKARKHTKEIAQALQITEYLSDIVDNTRQRLHGQPQTQAFNIIQELSNTIDFLYHKATEKRVDLSWQPPAESWKYNGDPTSFCQVIAILVNNALDSYSSPLKPVHRRVAVTTYQTDKYIIIRINDWGKKVPKNERRNLFKPQGATQKSDLGLGLYIARQTIVTLFFGTLTLNPRNPHTEFIIKLPRYNAE